MSARDDVVIRFGSPEGERLEFVMGRPNFSRRFTSLEDRVIAQIVVQAATSHGSARVSLMILDFTRLLPELLALYGSLRGTATFTTLEDQVGFTITGDGTGQMQLRGFLRDRPGSDNRLEYTLPIDRTLLWHSITEIDEFLFAATNGI